MLLLIIIRNTFRHVFAGNVSKQLLENELFDEKHKETKGYGFTIVSLIILVLMYEYFYLISFGNTKFVPQFKQFRLKFYASV